MSERVLVTGAAGYIGSVLVPHLLYNGYAVRALDLYKHRHFPLASCINYEGFEPIKGDCRDESVIKKCLDKVDWVIPLAALVGAPACDQDQFTSWTTNVDAIGRLVGQCKVPILFPNTNSAYGTTKPGEVSTEESPTNPISLYAQAKCAAESLLLRNTDNVVVFRLATVFGPSPRMRLDLLVNDFVHRAVKDKTVVLYEPHFRRNFMHVYDVARLFLFGIKNFSKLKEKKVFNAGLHYCLTKKELCKEIHKWVPYFQFFGATTGEDEDKRDYEISVQRLEDAGFTCATSLARGIRELVKLYQMMPIQEFSNA